MRPRPIVTIDGPAGCGKSTAAAALARTLGYLYLDTGAMYRALALKSLSRGIAATDARQLGRLARRTDVALRGDRRQILRVWLDGADVTRAIRTATVAARASEIAAIPAVRRAMVAQQRRLGRRGRVVAEGRDTGTVVFPDAAWKFYLTASPAARARRRWRDLQRVGQALPYAQVLRAVRARDRRDTTRVSSPLRRARGAILVDTTRRAAAHTLRTLLKFLRRHPVPGYPSAGRVGSLGTKTTVSQGRYQGRQPW